MLANRFLEMLPPGAAQRMAGHMKQVPLQRGEHLYNGGERIRYVFFPEGALLSMFLYSSGAQSLETVIIGREGASGMPSIMGDGITTHELEVQHPGAAWRMDASTFRDLFLAGGPFQRYALRYNQYLFLMATHSAFCSANHCIEERLARWLLMSLDGSGSASLHLTHEHLSAMLGVQRSSVTVVAQTLRDAGSIRYRRGLIQIVNRPMLEACSCACYQRMRRHERALLCAMPEA